MKKLLVSAAFVCAALSSTAALAEEGGNTASLEVSANVHSSCTVKFAAPKIVFNIARSSFSGIEQTSSFDIKCGAGVVNVSLSKGNGTIEARQMNGTGESIIAYNIYQGTDTQKIWGDEGDKVYPAKQDKNEFTVSIAQGGIANAKADGIYNDTLTATIILDGAAK